MSSHFQISAINVIISDRNDGQYYKNNTQVVISRKRDEQTFWVEYVVMWPVEPSPPALSPACSSCSEVAAWNDKKTKVMHFIFSVGYGPAALKERLNLMNSICFQAEHESPLRWRWRGEHLEKKVNKYDTTAAMCRVVMSSCFVFRWQWCHLFLWALLGGNQSINSCYCDLRFEWKQAKDEAFDQVTDGRWCVCVCVFMLTWHSDCVSCLVLCSSTLYTCLSARKTCVCSALGPNSFLVLSKKCS